MYQLFVNDADGANNEIRLLKTDLNMLIRWIEIDQASFLKYCS